MGVRGIPVCAYLINSPPGYQLKYIHDSQTIDFGNRQTIVFVKHINPKEQSKLGIYRHRSNRIYI